MLFPKASKKGWLLIKQPGLVHTVKKTKRKKLCRLQPEYDEGVTICHMGDQGRNCSFVSAVRFDLRQNRTGVTKKRTSRILSTIQ